MLCRLLHAILAPSARVLGLGLVLGLVACGMTYSVPQQEIASAPFVWVLENPQKRVIEIWMHQGHILVESSGPGSYTVDVRVVVEVHAPTRSAAQRWLGQINQGQAQIDEQLIKLQLSMPLGAPLDSVDMRYAVKVPEDSDLRIYTKTGRIALRGNRGKVLVETDGGQITARTAGGTATFRSNTGPIRIEGQFEAADLESQSGPLEVVLPDTPREVQVTMQSERGAMQIEMSATRTMRLDYASQGKFASELPVLYEDHRDLDGDGGTQFLARVGQREAEASAQVRIRSGFGNVEVRRLPVGSK